MCLALIGGVGFGRERGRCQPRERGGLIAGFYLVDRRLRHRVPGICSLSKPVYLAKSDLGEVSTQVLIQTVAEHSSVVLPRRQARVVARFT